MMWLAANFGASALGNLLGNGAYNKQVRAQNRATYAQNQRMILQAGQEANAAYAQMGALASQATGQLAEADRLSTLQRGEQAVTAAASGTTGASVRAVQMDIDRQQAQSREVIARDLMTQMDNLRNQASAAYASAGNNLGTAVKAKSGVSGLFGALGSAAFSTGAVYARQLSQFGSTK